MRGVRPWPAGHAAPASVAAELGSRRGLCSPRAPGELGALGCGSQPSLSLDQHHLGSSKRSCPKHPQNNSVLIPWGRTEASVISETPQVILMHCQGSDSAQRTQQSSLLASRRAVRTSPGSPCTPVLWLSTAFSGPALQAATSS